MQSHLYSYRISKTLTALQSNAPVSITTESDSWFLVERMYALNTGDFKTWINDSALNYNWSNLPVHNYNMFGTVEFPAELCDPIPLAPSTEITARLTDLSNLPNTIEIVLEGYRSYQPLENKNRRWYQYVKDITIAGSNMTSDSLQINADSDFLVKKLNAYKDAEADIKMASTEMAGRYLMNDYISLGNLFGRALLPNKLRHPLKLKRQTLLQLEMRNQSALSNTIQLCFEGVKLWGNE